MTLILQTVVVIFKSDAKVLLFFDMAKSFYMLYNIIFDFSRFFSILNVIRLGF